jgi:polar amino acid transport system substrate-binding protein
MKRQTHGFLCTIIIACMSTSIAHAQQMANADPRVADLIRANKIRIGVFPATQFFRDSSGEPRGIAIEMARMLAARIGIRDVVTVEYPKPPMVVECVRTGGCDLGFMSYDQERAKLVDFAPAHIRRDFTYLVPVGSSIHRADDANRPGIRIAVVRGHASTAALIRLVKQASPVYAETEESAVDLVRTGQADAFASVRAIVLRRSTDLPGSRVLDDGYETNLVAIALPKGGTGRIAFISEFLDDLKRSGWLRRAIEDGGLRGFEVVPPKEPN